MTFFDKTQETETVLALLEKIRELKIQRHVNKGAWEAKPVCTEFSDNTGCVYMCLLTWGLIYKTVHRIQTKSVSKSENGEHQKIIRFIKPRGGNGPFINHSLPGNLRMWISLSLRLVHRRHFCVTYNNNLLKTPSDYRVRSPSPRCDGPPWSWSSAACPGPTTSQNCPWSCTAAEHTDGHPVSVTLQLFCWTVLSLGGCFFFYVIDLKTTT